MLERVKVEPRAQVRRLDPFSQGAVLQTGRVLDLAISGGGFFLVRDPQSNRKFATRVGRFRLESQVESAAGGALKADQLIVNEAGLRLQGLNDAKRSVRGDLRIDTQRVTNDPSGTAPRDFYINGLGEIYVLPEQGEAFIRGQVVLHYFRRPDRLKPFGETLYTDLEAAEPMDGPNEFPGDAQSASELMHMFTYFGHVESGALELIKRHSERWIPISVTGTLSSSLIVEASSDLVYWQEIGFVLGSYYGSELIDKQALPLQQRFYRVRELYRPITSLEYSQIIRVPVGFVPSP